MKKRLTAVLLAAVAACPLFTLPASASVDERREWNGSFYSYSFEQLENAEVLNSSFEFSHPVYSADTGGFSCKWDRVFNVSAEVGCGMPEGYAGKNYKVFDMLELTYNADFYTDGNGYFGVHGWTQNPLVEYYIIEGWGSWRPPGGQGFHGSVTVNGRVYDVYQTMRNKKPSIEGERTFPQYFAVRQENPVTEHVQNRVKGTVDICKVFSEFEKKGFDMSGELYSCGLVVEAYGGGMGDASGYFTVHSASRRWTNDVFFLQGTDWFLTDTVPPLTGDTNCNGRIDVADAVLVMRYAVADREAVISEQGLRNADTDKNGNTDAEDATNILLHIAKKRKL